MERIDGKALAKKMRESLKEQIGDNKIGLAVVLVGENPASQVYVRNKIKACEEVSISSYAYYLPASTTQKELEALLLSLAEDKKIHGILVQLPLPAHLDEKRALALIPHAKDVDGFGAENLGRLAMQEDCLVACTPFGVMQMLKAYHIDPRGKHAVVLGRSNIVGKPMAMLLLNADATVTVCHSKTPDLKAICLQADILVVAIGRAKFVTGEMVKEGAVVVDVGMNRDEDSKLCGDVEFDSVAKKASFLTPVPGGVGPMTITMLLYNTFEAWKRISHDVF